MKKTASRKILWVLTFGLIGWVRVAIEDILLNGWDVFFNNITNLEHYLTHWDQYTPVYLLIGVGLVARYIYDQSLEGKKLIFKLQEKESFLTTVMKATPDYIWMLDKKFRIQYFNHTGSTLTREELIGKPIYTFLPLESQQREKKHLEHALKADSPYKYETTSFSPDGTITFFENIAVALKSENKVVGLVISSRNITQERKINEYLRDSEMKYEILVKNSLQGIAIIQDDTYKYVNPAFARTVGYSVDEMLRFSSEDVWELIHPEDKEILEQRNIDLLDGMQVTPVQKFRYIRNDGTIKWVESQLTTIQYNGKPAVQIFEMDITERLQAELQLQESEEKYRSLFDRIPVGLYRTTPEGEILAVNRDLLTMLNFSSVEELEKFDVFSTSEYPKEQYNEIMEKEGEVQGFEYQLKKVDGSSIFVRENSKAFKDKDGSIQYYEGSMEDITDRKQMEITLAQQSSDLQKRMKELNCLYRLSKIIAKLEISIEAVIQKILTLIPSAWQYPEITCVRINLKGSVFVSEKFKETVWSQVEKIFVSGISVGIIEVYYLEERTDKDGEPFLREERDLLENIALAFGNFIESTQAANILRESEARFKTIFDNANDGILVMNQEQQTIHILNSKMCQMLGYTKEEILKFSVNDLYPKKDLPFILKEFGRTVGKGIMLYKDIPLQRKDGSIFFTDINASKISIGGENYFMGIFRDITIRKQAEEALTKAKDFLESEVEIATQQLREEKQRIEAIIETSPNAIVVLDNSGTVTLSNHAFKKLFFRINDSHPPRDLNIIQKAEGALIAGLKELFSSIDLEARIIEPIPGYHLQLLSSRIGEIDNTHSGQVIQFFDVTPFVEFEKTQKKFITTISHELRTPITSISLSVGNLKKYRSKMTEEQYEYLLNAVEENTQLLGEIVEGATLLSKIQSGDYELNNQSYSLSSLLEISLKLTKLEAKLKDIEIIVELESEIEMIGDWLKIEKVLKVLFSNAIKYSPKKGVVKISVENNYFGKYNKGRVKGTLIKINDKGPGIKEEDIQKIFEPFHKTEDSRDIQGLGLGLHLAQKIAKIHEGEIFVESEFGKGSTFFLFLPYMSKSKELE